MQPASPNTRKFFYEHLGINEQLLEQCLSAALSAGGDYADLYFEYVTASSLMVDESLVKSASQGISAGCGLRVVSGERTGYAYTDDLSPERLLRAAHTAALIASGPSKQPVQGFRESASAGLYTVASPGSDSETSAKLALIQRADRAARAYDTRIVQVQASFADELRRILVAASDGSFATDTQPLARLNVSVIAKEGENIARGSSGGGGRVLLDFFLTDKTPEYFATEAAR
ncbi:MAG: TldD/PmbA family protein, partial [Acidobacteriaceae bacterium]